jgi:hypothetical protein
MCTSYEGLESCRLDGLDSSLMHSFSDSSVSLSSPSALLKRKPSFVCSKRK